MSRAEVEAAAGRPSKIFATNLEGERIEAWSYPVAKPLASTVPEVVFDKNGRVTDVYVDDTVQLHSRKKHGKRQEK